MQLDYAKSGYSFNVTVEQIIGLSLTLFVMCFGLAGSVLPGVPSTPLVMLAAVAHRLYFGAASVDNWGLAVLGALMVLSLVMDYLASMAGAKKLGATWRGVLGAVVGGLVGIFFNLPGIIFGATAGILGFLSRRRAGQDIRRRELSVVIITLGIVAILATPVVLLTYSNGEDWGRHCIVEPGDQNC